jgi:hypothetical protein
MSLWLEVVDGRMSFAPGEEVELRAAWDLKRAPDTVEIRMVWHTAGKGDRDMAVAKTIAIDSPAAIGDQRLAVILPLGPYSFSGKLISLLWGLELVTLPDEQSTRIEVTIAPNAREVLIGVAKDDTGYHADGDDDEGDAEP